SACRATEGGGAGLRQEGGASGWRAKACAWPAVPAPPGDPPPRGKPLALRLVPLAILCGGLVAFFALGWHRYVSFEMVRIHRSMLMALVSRWGVMAPLAFIPGYALMAAVFTPRRP